MTPAELAAIRASAAPHVLLDVRTTEELHLARLDPCLHIPLHELHLRVEELRAEAGTNIVCLCHHGIRSGMAADFLRKRGFSNVYNLSGGIDAYAREIEPGLPRY